MHRAYGVVYGVTYLALTSLTFYIFHVRLNIALIHVLVIGMSGDLNSSLFYRRAPVKRMKYSISHEY